MKLRELRIEQGLKQEDIALPLHTSCATVSRWERKINEPDNATLIKISEILGVSVDRLLGRENPTSALDPEGQ